jgi:outer membrane lipopolysaccharide assembly protein LptE/RlpB
MNLSRRTLLASLVSGLLLTGCGYQLRGIKSAEKSEDATSSSLSYRYIYILSEGADVHIVKQLRRLIVALGAEIVDDPMKAEIEIVLGESQWKTVASAIGNYGEISARLVILVQNIQIRQIGSDHWIIDTQIRRSREVDQASSLISGIGAERPLAILRESDEVTSDVRQRVVEALIRLIQGLAPLEPKP